MTELADVVVFAIDVGSWSRLLSLRRDYTPQSRSGNGNDFGLGR